MNARDLLRASLIPLGAALVMRGLQDLRATADELQQLVDERRAYLAGDGPLPAADAGDDEHQDVDEPAAPEDFRREQLLEDRPAGNSPVRALAVTAAGMVAGFLIARRVGTAVRRAQVAALVNAHRSAQLVDEPPAPGSPADLAARERRATARAWEDGTTAGRAAGDVDEHLDVDELELASAYERDARNAYACPYCAHVEPVKMGDVPGSRAARLALHRNRHQRGLVGG